MEIRYENYTGTIKGLAYKYSQTTGISSQELISAGNEHFVAIQKKFKPEKSCFNTYLSIKLRGLFLNMGKKRAKKAKYEMYNFNLNQNYTYDITPERQTTFDDVLSGLSRDAKKVVNIVFDSPPELISLFPKKQPRFINKFILTKYLKKQGWNIGRILNAFNDIESIWN